jgi:hypothetical protein
VAITADMMRPADVDQIVVEAIEGQDSSSRGPDPYCHLSVHRVGGVQRQWM